MMAKGLLFNASINRSPSSYLLNPEAERNEYVAEGNTDKTMLALKFSKHDGELVGVLNWFAVHGTSMNSSNQASRPVLCSVWLIDPNTLPLIGH